MNPAFLQNMMMFKYMANLGRQAAPSASHQPACPALGHAGSLAAGEDQFADSCPDKQVTPRKDHPKRKEPASLSDADSNHEEDSVHDPEVATTPQALNKLRKVVLDPDGALPSPEPHLSPGWKA